MYVYMYTKNSFRIYLCTNSTLWKLLLTSQIVQNFNDGQGQVLRQKYKTLNFVEAGKILTGLYWPKGEEYIVAKNPQLKKNVLIIRIPLMVFNVALLQHG